LYRPVQNKREGGCSPWIPFQYDSTAVQSERPHQSPLKASTSSAFAVSKFEEFANFARLEQLLRFNAATSAELTSS
jgi:hypothetical protein